MAQTRTLRLAKETLSELSVSDLASVAGGYAPPTLYKTCPIPTLNGCLTGVYPTLDDCTL